MEMESLNLPEISIFLFLERQAIQIGRRQQLYSTKRTFTLTTTCWQVNALLAYARFRIIGVQRCSTAGRSTSENAYYEQASVVIWNTLILQWLQECFAEVKHLWIFIQISTWYLAICQRRSNCISGVGRWLSLFSKLYSIWVYKAFLIIFFNIFILL